MNGNVLFFDIMKNRLKTEHKLSKIVIIQAFFPLLFPEGGFCNWKAPVCPGEANPEFEVLKLLFV